MYRNRNDGFSDVDPDEISSKHSKTDNNGDPIASSHCL